MQTNISDDLSATPAKPPLAHCSVHGLKFPLKSACPLCLHGLSTGFAHRSRNRRTLGGVVGLAVVGLVLAALPMSWIEKGLRAAMPFQILRAQNADLNLNVHRYSQEILLLEAVLYSSATPQYFDGERIALFSEQLAAAISAKEKAPTAVLARRRLRAFADRAQKNIIAGSATGIDLKAIQKDWENVHAQIFSSTNGVSHTPPTEKETPIPAPAAPPN